MIAKLQTVDYSKLRAQYNFTEAMYNIFLREKKEQIRKQEASPYLVCKSAEELEKFRSNR